MMNSARSTKLTVGDLGESGVLKALRRRLGAAGAGIAIGIGDDAAVLGRQKQATVVTADMLVEDVDFAWRWARASDVGCKAAAVNLSDLAAMGAAPRALLASVACNPTTPVRLVVDILVHLLRFGAQYGAPLVGGDLSGTRGPMVIAVTAVGEVAPRRALRRYAGRPGDVIAVTGTLGQAAVGLRLLVLHGAAKVRNAAIRRQLRPVPRVAMGLALARHQGVVRSVADISDGLAKDVQHVLGVGCGALLYAEWLPRSTEVRRMDGADLALSLGGGEDFELVMAVPRRQFAALVALGATLGVPVTQVGVIEKGQGVRVVNAHGARLELPRAYEHFGPPVDECK